MIITADTSCLQVVQSKTRDKVEVIKFKFQHLGSISIKAQIFRLSFAICFSFKCLSHVIDVDEETHPRMKSILACLLND